MLKLQYFKILLIAAYIPPDVASRSTNSLNDFFVSCCDQALDSHPDYDIIFAGDLNRFDLSYLYSSLNLINNSNKPTYANAELDYILFSETLAETYRVTISAPFDRSKVPHLSLHAVPMLQFKKMTPIERSVLDLRASNVEKFESFVSEINWDFMDEITIPLNAKCEMFHSRLQMALDQCVPSSRIQYTHRDKPWITPVVKDLINKRWSAFRSHDFGRYVQLKKKVQEEIKKSKLLWTKRMEHADVWRTVNCHLGKNSSQPILSLISKFECVHDAVEALNEHLHSVFITSPPIDESNIPISRNESWSPDVSENAVRNFLEKLPRKKASPDLPNFLYKKVSHWIASPLSKLMKLCIEECSVPSLWKKASISPIPKTRSPGLDDIRPISLLTPPAKILERIVLDSVKEDLLKHYDPFQFGFRPKSSTQCALVSLHNHITRHLDDSSTFAVLVISYDYTKAFDRLRSDIIINRLVGCDFPRKLILWMVDYLSNRTQYVKLGVTESTHMSVGSGVPQGSILGPYLYSFATATYYPSSQNADLVKYADDTTLVIPLFKHSKNDHVFDEHRHLLSWSRENDLVMNMSKCKLLVVQKPNTHHEIVLPDIPVVNELKLLGVFFNNRMTWSTNVREIIKKCSRLLFAMRVLRGCLSENSLKQYFSSLVKPIMDYCAPLFIGMSSSDTRSLSRLQSRFHRMVCDRSCNCPVFRDVEERRTLLSLKLLNHAMNPGHILHEFLPPLSNSGRFLLPPRRTQQRSNTFILRGCLLYNETTGRK